MKNLLIMSIIFIALELHTQTYGYLVRFFLNPIRRDKSKINKINLR